MTERLKKLYKTVILRHNKTPYHFHKNQAATHQLEAYNALCGDKFLLFFDIEEEKLKNISFHGYGCAIAKAATSVLVKNIEDKTIAEALALCATYEDITHPVQPITDIDNEELKAFESAKEFPGRLQCATLSWKVVADFLKQM